MPEKSLPLGPSSCCGPGDAAPSSEADEEEGRERVQDPPHPRLSCKRAGEVGRGMRTGEPRTRAGCPQNSLAEIASRWSHILPDFLFSNLERTVPQGSGCPVLHRQRPRPCQDKSPRDLAAREGGRSGLRVPLVAIGRGGSADDGKGESIARVIGQEPSAGQGAPLHGRSQSDRDGRQLEDVHAVAAQAGPRSLRALSPPPPRAPPPLQRPSPEQPAERTRPSRPRRRTWCCPLWSGRPEPPRRARGQARCRGGAR